MHIDLEEAIGIHAKVSRTRYGRGAKKRALKIAERLRRDGDNGGWAVWQQVAAEIDRHGKAKHARVAAALAEGAHPR